MMVGMTDALKEMWTLLGAGVAAIVWGVRLEGKAAMNASEVARLRAQVRDQRSEDRQAFRDAMDRIDHRLDEVGGDVKELLKEARK